MHTLWIRVGALGDLLIATAALEEAMAAAPEQNFWVMGSSLWLQLLAPARWPKIEKIIVLARTQDEERIEIFQRDTTGLAWTKSGAMNAWTEALVDCQHVINHRIESYRFAIAPFLMRIKRRTGSCPWIYHWLYTHWSPWLGKDPDVHERDWHLLVATAHGPGPRSITKARLWAEQIIGTQSVFRKWRVQGLPDLRGHLAKSTDFSEWKLDPSRPLILVNPTSSRREKAWPSERFLTLVGRLRSEYHGEFEIRVIGAPNETDWLNEVEPGEASIIQPQNLSSLIDLVGRAKLLITNTSSMQFLAAGTKTRTITLMGRTNPRQWGPLGPEDLVIQGAVPPDFKGNIFEQDKAALASMTIESVCSQIEAYVRGL
jgi:ADP-heptose:LPS heptosyltransferase